MDNHNLLDYTETYPAPFDPSDLSLPIRWLTALYLLSWAINLAGIWIPDANEWIYSTGVFNGLYLLMGIGVVAASNSKKRSNDVWIKRYRVVVWIGMGMILFYRLFESQLGYDMGYVLFSRSGYYVAFTGLALWLIRRWRLREQAGRWWLLWERWSWFWAAGNFMNYLIFSIRFSNDFSETSEISEFFWKMVNWGTYMVVLLLTLPLNFLMRMNLPLRWGAS